MIHKLANNLRIAVLFMLYVVSQGAAGASNVVDDTNVGQKTSMLSKDMAALLNLSGNYEDVSDLVAQARTLVAKGEDYRMALRSIEGRIATIRPEKGVRYSWSLRNSRIAVSVGILSGEIEETVTLVWVFDDAGKLANVAWSRDAERYSGPGY